MGVADSPVTALDRVAPDRAAGPPGPPVGQLKLDLGTLEPDQTVPAVIEYAAKLHASDLFLYSNEDHLEVAVRHLGMVRSLGRLPAEFGRRCLSYVKTAANMNFSERRRPMDGRWLFSRRSGQRLDLRINTIPTLYGEDCTLRILDQEHRLLSVDQLGMDGHHYGRLTQFLANPNGLLLVTGPTESGKSTTLYACLSQLNNGERKINTIEDPIEYSLRGIRQTQVNAGLELTFDALLRHVLRQAPDVIMIGEIRDAETAMTAVRAAGSGHLVLATLHAPVASAAVHSLLRLGVHPYLLSNALLGVVSQRLLRTLCSQCKVTYEVPAPKLFEGIRPWLGAGEGTSLSGPTGCSACFNTGYAGRTGVFEMLRVTPAIRELIDDSSPVSAIRKKAGEEGMIEFRQSALLKVAHGLTSIEEVVRVLPGEYLLP
ncbi:MAG: type secretion system protein [Gemmataceae bacterium]|nr:type secretion system protein [Gemmataceae bacterium]